MEVKSDKKTLKIARFSLFLFTVIFLGVFNWEFLYKLQNVSYFVFSDALLEETVGQSGGLLSYVSAFCTQILYYPMLGAFVLALLLSGLEWLISKLTGSVVVSFLSVGLILLAQTSIGYAIYDNFRPSFVFSIVLGFYVAVALALVYKKFASSDKVVYSVIVAASILYFFVGLYACVTLLFIAINAWVTKEKGWTVKLPICVALCLLLPYVAANVVYHENFSSTICAPVPPLYFMNLFVITILTMVLLALSPLFCDKIAVLTRRLGQPWAPYAAVALLCVGVFFASCRDSNYHTEFKMQRLTEAHQWDELLKVADEVERPSSTIFAYRAIALACKNRLADQVFKYPCNFKRVKTNYVSEQPRYYEDLFLYGAFVNNSYLWSMEFWCTTGYSYEHLKKMTICSLLNDEPMLANKYIQVLKQSLFQREWALEYEGYVNHLDKMLKKYPEFADVKANMPKGDALCRLEAFRKVYSNYSFLSKKNAERRLLADLYNKDMKTFFKDAMQTRSLYAKSNAPDCVKEGLVICAMMQGDPSILKGFRVSQSTVNDVQNAYNLIRASKDPEAAKEAIAKYKGRYFYFYFVANN